MSLLVKALTVGGRPNPLGTDGKPPQFGWKLEAARRGTLQTACRIQVADAEDGFDRPLWDTGKTESDASIRVTYEGPAPVSRTRYFYRVKAWDNFGGESDWSEIAWWETGLLSEDEWQARWITPDPAAIDPLAEPVFALRKSFELKGDVRSARVYATGVGVYDLYLNGEKVGDDILAPGWTSYRNRLQYQTYDVTDRLRAGSNGLGVLLANGWYKGDLTWSDKSCLYGDRRAALVQLHVTYADGTEEIVVSDPTWSAALGPIRYSEIYHGEIYDARLELGQWSRGDFDASEWAAAASIDLPMSVLVPQENWPTRVTETIRPVAFIRTPSGEAVLDMGQNMVGRIRLSVEAPAGTAVRLQHAEVLDKEGNFYVGNLRSAKQTVEYIAKGEGTETYAPHFTFQGFRYVKVEGYPGIENGLPLDRFVGEVIHSDMPRSGEFECSHELVNQLQRNIVWGQRGNFLDVPTDCPQRDERLGWTGDAQVFVWTAAFNYDVGPFFQKWLRDLAADQKEDGGVPFVIPDVLDGDHSSAAWGDAAVVVPWAMYATYGDKALLAEQFDSMKAWVDYIRAQGESEYLWNTGFHFGDWLGLDAKENSYVGATPRDLIATAFYAYSAKLVRDAAEVLGREEDARKYGELYGRVVSAFREEFVTPSGRIAAPTQTAHVLALMFDLAEGEARARTARELNKLIEDNEFHLTTGFVGTPYLCHVLSANGYHETALKLLVQEGYPSWLYSVNQGATTIWEHWDGIKPDGSFWSDDMNSYNHYAYGAIGDWLYRVVAGLDADGRAPAYKRARIEPRFGGEWLTSARAAYDSAYGRIEVSWRADGISRAVEVALPPNTTAEVLLRGAALDALRESGRPVRGGAEGIASAADTADGVRLAVGSGVYRFEYPLA
ncbi:alpha-L-rhamnosidase [Cohnella algarum]|uniref:alpha-L-rhamnosidase n=1 Tax=Cohnella algarum TaxID=2044859 RepID=UPI001966E59B|nr:alpha-L-rhamnosidase [Cohnella algarum]MBN2983117.1 family 78 glycoside hydrolase catalytic domain [Cohnella algarum]